MRPAPRGQGQTLFADGIAAHAALPETLKAQVAGLEGLHVGSSAGRRREAVAAGQPPRALAPHERPQRQPVVRIHPVTGQPALYLCEHGQMDWLEGPLVGLKPGPEGAGAALPDALMAHLTQPEFVYVHEWTPGTWWSGDNRCTVHAATLFDAAKEARVMWRTTVSGNPGQPMRARRGAGSRLDPGGGGTPPSRAACAAGRKAMVNTADAGDPERLVLFGSFTSSSSYKPMLFLSLSGLPFSFRTVNLKNGCRNRRNTWR